MMYSNLDTGNAILISAWSGLMSTQLATMATLSFGETALSKTAKANVTNASTMCIINSDSAFLSSYSVSTTITNYTASRESDYLTSSVTTNAGISSTTALTRTNSRSSQYNTQTEV